MDIFGNAIAAAKAGMTDVQSAISNVTGLGQQVQEQADAVIAQAKYVLDGNPQVSPPVNAQVLNTATKLQNFAMDIANFMKTPPLSTYGPYVAAAAAAYILIFMVLTPLLKVAAIALAGFAAYVYFQAPAQGNN